MARPRRPRATVPVLAAFALVAGLAGCTASAPEPDAPTPTALTAEPTSGPTGASGPTTPAAPTTAPTDASTGTPTGAPADVPLTGSGIGDVTIGSDADDALVAALGTPTEPLHDYCRGAARMTDWGGLTAYLHIDGTLIGWSLEPGTLPDVVRPPHGILPGEPLARVLALGGVPEPVVEPEDTGQHMTTVDDVTWWSDGDTADMPVTMISAAAPGCS